jgi:hypothetical protein
MWQWMIGLILIAGVAQAATNSVTPAVRAEGMQAVARGVAWLEAQQRENGSLGAEKYPAVTALALAALRAGGSTNALVLNKAGGYLQQAMAKGSNDWTRGFSLAICQSLLTPATAQPKEAAWVAERRRIDREYSARARDFELRQRSWQQERAALLEQGIDADFSRATALARNLTAPEAAPRPAVASAVPRRGYGSLSYDGALRLLHEKVAADDPRVDAYLDWASRHWTLAENPGKGHNGLYFFYHAMSKCLAASGEEFIHPLDGGAGIPWREELIRKLVALQQRTTSDRSGYWVNEVNSYLEGDPVLVTAYAILTLQHAMGR